MKQLMIKPTIYKYDTCREFCHEFRIGKEDLILTNKRVYEKYLKGYVAGAAVIFRENYGAGEPSDQMVEAIYQSTTKICFDRVVAIGGGSILDLGKLLALKNIVPVFSLFEKRLEIVREKELILVPTTCGTGSEVTNISILEFIQQKTKFGLAVDELYADSAVLIPEVLECLPYSVFVTSSLDAFIHAIESYLSVKATSYSRMYSLKAMEILLQGYCIMEKEGKDARFSLLSSFLEASNYAGIAFGNAGCGAVHALSYPLGATYHIPHGESNYAVFHGVFQMYEQLKPDGEIRELNTFLAGQLNCKEAEVYERLEQLFSSLLPKKRLREYGVKQEELEQFTTSVMEKQGRLMANNYTKLEKNNVAQIYESLY